MGALKQNRLHESYLVKKTILDYCFNDKCHNTFKAKHISSFIPDMNSHKVSFYLREFVRIGFLQVFSQTKKNKRRVYRINDEIAREYHSVRHRELEDGEGLFVPVEGVV